MAIQPKTPSTYRLRCQPCPQHLCTVEVAIALLEQLDEMTASRILHAYFRVFAEACMAARHGHLLTKSLPEMAQLLAYNGYVPQPGPSQFPLPAGEGFITG
jgi:DTW domain-containing protein YfiP